MSAALERLKQQTAHDEQPGRLDSPETIEVLTSILSAVEAQNMKITQLTERQKELAGFLRVMDEQQVLQLEQLANRLSISSPSANALHQGENVEQRLNEIEKTLTEFVTALDGRQLQKAVSTLITEASRNRTAMASATERAAAQVAVSNQLVKQAHGAAVRIEKQAEAAIGKVTADAADLASGQVLEKIQAAEVRADKIFAVVDRVEARQLWTATGAMCLSLLPAATVVLGGILIVAGLVYGWEIAVTTDAATWLRWVRGAGAAAGTLLALVGLVAAVRWVAAYVSTWRSTPGFVRRRR